MRRAKCRARPACGTEHSRNSRHRPPTLQRMSSGARRQGLWSPSLKRPCVPFATCANIATLSRCDQRRFVADGVRNSVQVETQSEIQLPKPPGRGTAWGADPPCMNLHLASAGKTLDVAPGPRSEARLDSCHDGSRRNRFLRHGRVAN